MTWLFLALLAPALDTIVSFVDKYVVEHKLKDSYSIPVYSGITALCIGTLVWLIFGMPTMTARDSFIFLLSGAIFMWANALFFHAIAKSQTSYIIALLQASPLFVLILSAVLLHEHLSITQVAGFMFVLVAVLGLSIDRVERKVRLSVSFYQIMAANTLYAASSVLIKYADKGHGLTPVLVFGSWGSVLGALILLLIFKKIKNAFLSTFREAGRSTLGIMFLNDSLSSLSQAVFFLAITLGPVALVSVLMGTQVFYGIVAGVVLTLFLPKIFHEDIARRDIAMKLAMSLILFIGVWCISA